jgi:hypothetical protein
MLLNVVVCAISAHSSNPPSNSNKGGTNYSISSNPHHILAADKQFNQLSAQDAHISNASYFIH